ncbi:bifunctional 2-C-methyl-D-erythritol 4-phosphate cytidylyltransferase/2-C-methyl-D-erythritol 2,4-cyclodiphosphate synthase [Sphingomonas sp. R1]|uniref:bifunctional 2-C-methyl-D-erythritol 4-phosphate cytidylyltransferase/2-C-methyl-D-erythritol 2,4-cyclodiphosphate synthase n=1 Tax=Sphingomonas sp. R1 TaxID=399176 RepID=UPI002224FD4F|nr:bifunctional 2-C-methyl-D-erythritol 4-phosphate cytidylyltransferase/2-C-methyl-D-erythritol 2,4-cyclodiphosphate synthase [Sphingomonas sp. R1]UYY78023.1 bifunctional 2-C-methyl-D-erythritol 4-phosphate cytidylyltransferase/2-C-methyl-D-erythritol 2,4-cyclodiphosphate synthase [Sphingomonas sp. R1]
MTATRTAALLVAAGSGTRAGGSVPKQYAPLGGKPLIAYAHQAFVSHPGIDAVLTVIGEGQETLLGAAMGAIPFVLGGATRRESVRNGLDALRADGFTRVLIHDAARPFLPARVIDALFGALDACAGAVPALPVADTLVRGEDGGAGDVVPRDQLYRVQTPQAFVFDALLDAHRRWPAEQEATDDAQMLRAAGGQVALVPGDPMLEKITHPADFAAAEARLASTMRVRTATGYDVHRFAEGEELWLGGVRVPHSKGLSGHSDADVALHAITDALLGTIGAGDIGMHFPPSDPQWRGAASARFLEHAASLVAAEGGVLDFIDLTLICEAPKIGPHREAIRTSVAAILGLELGQVSIKATTTERLGFTGRGEGMAAQAVATVRVPARN